MYWIFLAIFIVTVLVPDIVRTDYFSISETRIEEMLIFLMGAVAFFIFIKNEQKLIFHKKEKAKDQEKIDRAVKDLVESYSYIGEVNRKMDILMNIALGLSDSSILSKAHENETYKSIVGASNFLLKADFTSLRIVDTVTLKTKKEFQSEKSNYSINNTELVEIGENINIKKKDDCLIVSSNQNINNIKSYIIIYGYDKEEENSPKNLEILKVFASQALFLYAYAQNKICPPNKK